MPPDPNMPEPRKKRVKDFAKINSVKMCKVSGGRRAHTCKHCKTNHKFDKCPFCGK